MERSLVAPSLHAAKGYAKSLMKSHHIYHYIQFDSHMPESVKSGLIEYLTKRARTVCIDPSCNICNKFTPNFTPRISYPSTRFYLVLSAIILYHKLLLLFYLVSCQKLTPFVISSTASCKMH